MKIKDRLRYQVDICKREKGFSYGKIATLIGINNSDLSKYMNGVKPTSKKKQMICDFFKKDASYFWR